jgi:hypothetical protein
MTLPFTSAQFFGVMQAYNVAVWPAQVVLTLLALGCVVLVLTQAARRSVLIAAALSLLWAWSGIAYHLVFFSRVNPAAWLFGALFVSAAGVFAWQGVIERRLHFDAISRRRAAVGLALIAYALVVYPELANAFGHAYPVMPTFGLPCPLTIFTIGLLATLTPPYPRWLLVAPVVWALIALEAAFAFGMYEDLGLAAAALVGGWLALPPTHKANPA